MIILLYCFHVILILKIGLRYLHKLMCATEASLVGGMLKGPLIRFSEFLQSYLRSYVVTGYSFMDIHTSFCVCESVVAHIY